MKGPAIFQSYLQNALRDATITATASPLTSYDLESLAIGRPDFRVRFATGTVTIRFTPGASRLGDVFVLPMHNLDAGSPSVAILSNDVGLTQAIPIPPPLGNGLPRTIVVDLTIETADPTDRTPTYWELAITGNSNPVTLGGAVAIYGPKTYLVDRDFQWGYTQRLRGGMKEHVNEYGTVFRQNFGTLLRSIDVTALATEADADAIENWFIENTGRGLPGLLWFDSDIEDAYFGVWQETFERVRIRDEAQQIAIHFDELSKGLPL